MKTLLIIDDSALLVENLAEFFELQGYRVITSTNGKDGLKLANKELPDLVISDILMPHLDGHEVCIALHNHVKTRTIPFVFSSARSEQKDQNSALELGADAYLVKPYDPHELLAVVEKLLGKNTFRKD